VLDFFHRAEKIPRNGPDQNQQPWLHRATPSGGVGPRYNDLSRDRRSIRSRHFNCLRDLVACLVTGRSGGLSSFLAKLTQTFALQNVLSALPPKTDIGSAKWHARFGPEADIGRTIRSPRRRGRALMVAP
jgi:hypothetical protein